MTSGTRWVPDKNERLPHAATGALNIVLPTARFADHIVTGSMFLPLM
jgi:hypothetical protein